MLFGPDLTVEFKNIQKLYKLYALKDCLQEGSPEEQ